MRKHVTWGITLMLLGTFGCNKAFDARAAHDNLAKAGYSVGDLSADPGASGVAGVTGGSCFDASKGGATARVCLWTCTTPETCIALPPQKVTLRGTIAGIAAFVDTKDEAYGNTILRSMNP